MPTTRPALTRTARLVLAGLALPLGGIAALGTAHPAGAIEPNKLVIEDDAWITEETGGTVTVALSEGPALEDIDFTLTSNLKYSQTEAEDWTAVDVLATIPAGQTSVDVPMLPYDDDLIEGFEQFHVGITSITGPAVAGDEETAELSDDERASLAITLGDADVSELAVAEGDDGDVVVPVVVHVSTPLAEDAGVGFDATFGGGCTTTDAADLTELDDGSIEIKAGAHEGTGSIIVHGDTLDELDECANVWVSAYDLWTFDKMGDNSAELTILDDDDTVLSDAPHDDPECEGPSCDITSADPTDPTDPTEPTDPTGSVDPADSTETPAAVAADTATLPRTGGGATGILAAAGLGLIVLGATAKRTARRLR